MLILNSNDIYQVAGDTITVNYSTNDLLEGSYNAVITISDPLSTNNPQTVDVTLTLTDGGTPAISLSPTSLSPATSEGSSPSDANYISLIP